ncbi:hypothetical protein J3R83DRAFT_11178 [Lanmaoa asiatica]|nr:hypothetical protein J3R83DRAFT_11178 [Lanmaoa asiatica]
MSTNPSTPGVLLLPAPSPESLEDPSVPNVPIGANVPVRFDNLGPMVVSSDGVGSRIIVMSTVSRELRGFLDVIQNRQLGEHDRSGKREDDDGGCGEKQVRHVRQHLFLVELAQKPHYTHIVNLIQSPSSEAADGRFQRVLYVTLHRLLTQIFQL